MRYLDQNLVNGQLDPMAIDYLDEDELKQKYPQAADALLNDRDCVGVRLNTDDPNVQVLITDRLKSW